jgi:L-iditol 2-dehydrogenase
MTKAAPSFRTDPLPATMWVNVLVSAGLMQPEQRPVPRPANDQVLVRIGSVGICGSDVHYYRHGRIAEHVVRAPLVLGHEAGGVIVAVGADVPADRIGQRVALEPGVPCRHCRECKHGRYNLCANVQFFATPPVDGTFAEYVAIAADFAHPIPDSISDDGAGLIEPLSVGVWACGKAEIGLGSRVLISGAGPIGLMNVQVAKAAGASQIIVTDIAAARLDVATGLGATRVLNARSEDAADLGIEVDAFIDCSGAETAVRAGIRAVRPAGHVVLVGMGADDISLPVGLIQGRELKITGTFRYANTYPIAIELAASGAVRLDPMVTAHFTLVQAESALQEAGNPAAIKVIVRPGG